MALLEKEKRRASKGLIIINSGRYGDPAGRGLKQLEELCSIPVLGVVPYMDVDIEDEDSLSGKLLEDRPGRIDIAVIRFPRISNFTDFDVFARLDGVTVRYVTKERELGSPDMGHPSGNKEYHRRSSVDAPVRHRGRGP